MWEETSSNSIYMFPPTIQGKGVPVLGLRREGVSCGRSLSLSSLCPLNSLPFSLLEDTQSRASQPLPEKLQPWTKERQVLLLPVLRQGASALPHIPCTSSLPSWTFPSTPTVLYLTHLHPPTETHSAVEACWPPGAGQKWAEVGNEQLWGWPSVDGG